MTQRQWEIFLASGFFIILIFSLLGVFASRFDMIAHNKSAIHAEIRDFILDNPEIVFEAASIARQREAEAEKKLDAKLIEIYQTELVDDGYSFVGGNPDGDITLVEFVDYRCGYCRKAHEDIEALLKRDGNIRFIIKEFPVLGDASMISAQFAIAVKHLHGDEAYKMVHDTLIYLTEEPTPEALVNIASAFGLAPTPIIKWMMNDKVMEEINNNRDLGEKMRINGTPTFLLGDELLRGYLPLETMIELVDKARQ